jgi:hypothetical protein
MVNLKDSKIDDTDLFSFKNKFKLKIKILDWKQNATQRKYLNKQQNEELHKETSNINPSKLMEN